MLKKACVKAIFLDLCSSLTKNGSNLQPLFNRVTQGFIEPETTLQKLETLGQAPSYQIRLRPPCFLLLPNANVCVA